MTETKHWLRKAISNHKDKATHKMLGLPLEKPLPLYLLEEIKATPIGGLVKYSYVGKFGIVRRAYVVTKLMKNRVVLALTLIRIGPKKKVKE